MGSLRGLTVGVLNIDIILSRRLCAARPPGFCYTANRNSKETGVLYDESEGIPATVTELTELSRIIRLFPVSEIVTRVLFSGSATFRKT